MGFQFNKRLYEVMKQKNISQNKLRALSGVSQSMISDILNSGKSPSFDTIVRLLNGMGVSVQDFFQEESLSNKTDYPATVALHRDDNPDADLPEEAQKQIEDFRAYIRQKNKMPD